MAICVRTEAASLNGVPVDVVVQDPACQSGLVLATRQEWAQWSQVVQPLSADEAGTLATAIIAVLVLAFVLGKVTAFVWRSV